MPLVRCPECCREFQVLREDLNCIIECAVCDAHFGPVLPPARVLIPADECVEDWSAGGSSTRRSFPRELKPKPRTRVLPILLGTLVGLAATGAILGALYLVLISSRPAGTVEKPSPAPGRTARPGARP